MARDILGLGGPDANIKNLEGSDIDSASPADEQARRRRRMNEGADDITPAPTGVRGGSGGGATGIDMGAGGEGTDIE